MWARRSPLRRSDESDAERSACRFQGAGCRFECGQGGLAGDSERQPHLHCARGSELCRCLWQGEDVVAHLGSHVDETGQIAHWHIPAAHYLESWSDVRAYDGTVSIIQPMIDPLYGGQTAHDVFQACWMSPWLSPYDAVRETWKPLIKGDFETGWRKALHAGWIDGTALRQAAERQACVRSREPFPRPRRRIRWRSSSGPIPISTTAAGRMWAGCRNCPSR